MIMEFVKFDQDAHRAISHIWEGDDSTNGTFAMKKSVLRHHVH